MSRSLTRDLLVPTGVLTLVVAAVLVLVANDAASQSRALEREAVHVRAATSLALALTEATRDEAHDLSSLALRPGADVATRSEEAAARIALLATEVEALDLSPRAAGVWTQFVTARGALRPIAEKVVVAARRGDRAGVATGVDRWQLMADRSDRLLRNFTAHHLNRLDRTVAELQRRRARTFAAAAAAVTVGLLLASVLAAFIGRKVVRPIALMARASLRITETGTASPVAGAERRDEIGVLARAFNDMTARLVSTNATLASANARLAEAVRAREEFISVASHELRTPLTPLSLRVQRLLRIARTGPGDVLSREQVVQVTGDLDKHVGKLAKLVENLLDVSRINSGRLELRAERFPLVDAIRDAVERLSSELAAGGCEVRVACPPDLIVHADRSRLEQVLVNLLGNAAKYAPGGPVDVRLVAREPEAVIEVEDSGAGIGAGDEERIFDRFERAVPAGHVAGLGLGLYIAREIVRAHGGALSVRSAPGRGATFAVRLLREARLTG